MLPSCSCASKFSRFPGKPKKTLQYCSPFLICTSVRLGAIVKKAVLSRLADFVICAAKSPVPTGDKYVALCEYCLHWVRREPPSANCL